MDAFQSTRPVWGATCAAGRWTCGRGQFQSTRPVWGATGITIRISQIESRFNPRAPCGARLRSHSPQVCSVGFNPRAPCGARLGCKVSNCSDSGFNPRAPCGARLPFGYAAGIFGWFQSTRPVWGATLNQAYPYPSYLVSIHAPRVGRDDGLPLLIRNGKVSIHAPRVGRDEEN